MSPCQPGRHRATTPHGASKGRDRRAARAALILASLLAPAVATPAFADFTNITGRMLSGSQNRLQRAQVEEQHEQTMVQRQAAQTGQNLNNVIILNQSGNNNYLNLTPVQSSAGSQGVNNSVSDKRARD